MKGRYETKDSSGPNDVVPELGDGTALVQGNTSEGVVCGMKWTHPHLGSVIWAPPGDFLLSTGGMWPSGQQQKPYSQG